MIMRAQHRLFVVLVSAVFVVGSLLGIAPSGVHSVRAAADHAVPHASAAASYGNLPLSFIANAGQIDPAVHFQVRSGGGTLSFESEGVTLSLPSAIPRRGLKPTGYQTDPLKGVKPLLRTLPSGSGASDDAVMHVLRLSFDGANPNARLNGADQLPGIANFFIGSDPSQWHTNVPTYAGVVYHDLYPGVDLQYAGHAGLLKGTYTLAAGVDPALIRWRYVGADSVNLDSATGNLTIHAADNLTLTEQAPIAWQTRDGKQVPVTVGYAVNADGSVQFAPGSYDRALPLVIDPGLVYSSFLGGTGNPGALGEGIAIDGSGTVYVTGFTTSGFPTTPGAFQSGPGGYYDVFVSKLNPAVSGAAALLYSTYLGGSGRDEGRGIAVDSSGNVYVTGTTASANFPVTAGAFQPTFHGIGALASNAFVTKLNPSASGVAGLGYSTYLGGNGGNYGDRGNGIAVDGNGNAFVTGVAGSSDFPTTSNAFQTSFGGGGMAASNAFVSKLNPIASGASSLVYSTYLGGNVSDTGDGIKVDSGGNMYVTGTTNSPNFPTTAGAYQTIYNGGVNDAFVSRLNPSISGAGGLVYSAYLGGSAGDYGQAIARDAAGNIYIVGFTDSTDFPTTSGAYQTSFGGSSMYTYDVFIVKLNVALSGSAALVYSTYLGGASGDYGQGIAVDTAGNVYVTGQAGSTNFPVTTGAYQINMIESSAAFVSKLNPSASGAAQLVYSTYLGSSGGGNSGGDVGNGIALDGNGHAYVVGSTSGSDFPVTSNAYQPTYSGNTDAFISELDFVPRSAPTPTIDTIGVFRNGTFYLRLHNSTGYADIQVAFGSGAQLLPVVGDWTGAGYDTIGVYDTSSAQFNLCTANDSTLCANAANVISFTFGSPNDMPLSGRWLSNGPHTGIGVFRPSNGLIYLTDQLGTSANAQTMVLGIPGDIGLAGDWTGKLYDSPGVYRPANSTFYLSNQIVYGSVYADIQVTYGINGDSPIVGDWTALGHDGLGLFRPSNGATFLKNALTTGYADNTFTYGIAGDVPIAGHWQLVYPLVPNPGSVLVPATSAPMPTAVAIPTSGLGD